MSEIIIYHGSDHFIKKPDLKSGKINNDYGRGFYCTDNIEMAKEWACKNNTTGYVNTYKLDTSELKILNLLNGNYTVLNWIALLLVNRNFMLQDEISIASKEYIVNNYLVDISNYDIVIGYRADDSYFSFAQSFINNTLPLRGLNRALELGELGKQIVLISQNAFNKLEFIKYEQIDKDYYYSMYMNRDTNARNTYRNEVRKSFNIKEDIFILDIIREEMKNDDVRIPRIILK